MRKQIGDIPAFKIEHLKEQLFDKKTLSAFYIFLFLVIAYKIIFSYILIEQYGTGDARILLAKSIRGFDLIFTSLESIVAILLIFYFVLKYF